MNVMDCRAISRMDTVSYVGFSLWPLLKSEFQDPCPLGLPEVVAVAHIIITALNLP